MLTKEEVALNFMIEHLKFRFKLKFEELQEMDSILWICWIKIIFELLNIIYENIGFQSKFAPSNLAVDQRRQDDTM